MAGSSGEVVLLQQNFVMENGYCYLVWFHQYNVVYGENVFDLDRVKERLGKFPLLRRVIGFLFSYASFDFLLFDVKYTGFKLVHVNDEHLLMFSDIVQKFMFSSDRIGGDVFERDAVFSATDDVIVKMNDSVNKFGKICAMGGLDFDQMLAEAARRYLADQAKSPHSDLLNFCKVPVERSMKGSDVVDVKYRLTPKQVSLLQSEYPELKIVVSGTVKHPHAFAAAATRDCAEHLILRRLGIGPKTHVNVAGKDVVLVDAGANYVRHVLAGRFSVHCCNPIIDVRDSARETERHLTLIDLERKGLISSDVVRRYTAGTADGSVRCLNGVQNCSVKSVYGIFMHSEYDIGWNELGQAFDSHELLCAWSVILFDPSVFYKSQGLIPEIGCMFRKTGDYIVFSFVGDSSLSYRHKLSDYMRIVSESVLVTPKGRCYLSEKVDLRCGSLFIKYTLCAHPPMSNECFLSFNYWHDSRVKVISTWDYVDSLYSESKYRVPGANIVSFKRKFLEVDNRLVELIIGHCGRSGDKSFNLNDVYSAALTFNSRMCVNGSDIKAVNRVPIENLMDVVVALYCISYRERYSAGKKIERFVHDTKFIRDNRRIGLMALMNAFWSRQWSWTEPLRKGFNWVVDWCAKANSASFLDILLFESVKFIELSEFVNVCANYDDLELVVNDVNVSRLDVEIVDNLTHRVVEVFSEKMRKEEKGKDLDDWVSSSVVSVSADYPAAPKEFSNTHRKKAVMTFHKKNTVYNVRNNNVLHNMRKEKRSCEACVLVKVRGDGHCFFRAVAMFLGGMNHFDLRKDMWNRMTDVEKRDCACVEIVDGSVKGYGTADCIRVLNRLYDIDVCVHVVIENREYPTMCYNDGAKRSKCLHVRWGNDHVDVLEFPGVDPPLSENCYFCNKFECVCGNSRFGDSEKEEDESVDEYEKEFVSLGYDVDILSMDGYVRGGNVRQDVYNFLFHGKFREFNRYANLFGLGPFVNRSAYKLLDIIKTCSLDFGGKSVLDMCGAPGGFVQVSFLKGASFVTSFSLDVKSYHSSLVPSSRLELCEYDLSGSEEFLCALDRYDVVVADGANNNSYFDEDIVFRETALMTTKLKTGGVCVLKHGNVFDVSKGFLDGLCGMFSSVVAVKPRFSSDTTTEVYFVCKGFRSGTCVVNLDREIFKEYVDSVNYVVKKKKSLSVDELKDDVISYFSDVDVTAALVVGICNHVDQLETCACCMSKKLVAGGVNAETTEFLWAAMMRDLKLSNSKYCRFAVDLSDTLRKTKSESWLRVFDELTVRFGFEESLAHVNVSGLVFKENAILFKDSSESGVLSEIGACVGLTFAPFLKPGFVQRPTIRGVISSQAYGYTSDASISFSGKAVDTVQNTEQNDVSGRKTRISGMSVKTEDRTVPVDVVKPKGLKGFFKGVFGKTNFVDVSTSTVSYERVCKERKKRKLVGLTELSAFRECVCTTYGLVENKIRAKLYVKFFGFDWLPFSSVGQCVDAELIAKDVPRTPGVECLAKFDILSVMAAMTYHCQYGYMQGHLEILRDLEKSVGLSLQSIEFVLAKFPLGYVDDVFREAERYTVDVLKNSWESDYLCGEISTCVGSFVSRCMMTDELKMCFLDLLMVFDSKLISCILVAANEERMNVVKEISEFDAFMGHSKRSFEKLVEIPVDWIYIYHRVLKLLESMDLDYHVVKEAEEETHVDSVKGKSWKGSMRSLSSISSLKSDTVSVRSDVSKGKSDGVSESVNAMDSIAEESDSLSLVSSASSVSSIFMCGDVMTTDVLKERLPLDKKRGKYVSAADWFALPEGVKLVCVFSRVRSATKKRPYVGHALAEKFGLSKPKFRTRLGDLYVVEGEWHGYCFDCENLRVIVVEMQDRDVVESVFEDFLTWLPASVALTAFEFECVVNGILCLDAVRRNPRQCVFIQYRSNTFSALIAAMTPIDPSKPDEVPIDVFPALGNMNGARSPEYIECVDKLDYFRNSMIEYRHIERLTTEHILSKFDWLKEVLKDDFAGVNECVIERLERERMNIYDNDQGFNLFGGYSYICMYGLTEDGLVEYQQESHRFTTSRRYVAYGKEFEILLSDKVADRLNQYDILNVRLPEIDWVNGPPGCGKTHEILSKVEAPKFNSGKEMILCMTKQGVVDVAERLSEKKGIKPNGLKRGVRTVMSVLVNGCDRKLDKVYVDEALMSHAGSIAFVAVITQCEMLFLIGDVNQIPFIDRLHICPVRFGSMSGFAVVTRVLKASYRCPVDVVYALRDFYPGVYSMSDVVVSMRLRSYTHDITEIDRNAKGTLFLTHMQADKDQMIVDGYGRGQGSKVLTVEERMKELSMNEKGLKARKKRDERPSVMTPHEAQGLTYDHVVCIRRSVKPLKIFDSEPHAIVTISRHRKTFTYYTDVNDAVARLVQNVSDRDTMLKYNDVMKGAHKLTAGFAEDYHEGRRRVFLDERESMYEEAIVGLPFFSHRCERVAIEKGESFMLEKRPYAPLPKVQPDLAYLQTWYDDKIGENACVSVAHDPELIEFSDLIVNVDREISLNPADGVPKRARFDKLEPVLRTLVPSRRINSLKESLLGAMKRNLNAPVLVNEELSETKLAHYMVDNFINSAIPEDKMSLFESFKDNPIGIDARMVDEWLAKQPPAVRKLACSDTPAHLRSYNKFKFMIKNTVKPVMESGAAWKYASVQTIVYNDKSVNAIFCPIFNAMSERLYAVLSEKIMILTNCSNEEFEREINRRFNIAYLKICQCVENDMSKYDKSQGEVLRIMEDLIFFLLGMPLWLIRIWSAAHRRTHLRDWLNGLYVALENQRKSGDPSTFFGNTLVLLIILCAVYDLREILLMILAGDDSCLFLLPGASAFGYDPSSRVADFFNLECKLLDNYRVPYFCSKFLVFTDEWLFLVPDPLKVVTKLGRRDLVNEEHVEEYRVSCEDVLKPLFNAVVCEGLSVGVSERYGGFMSDCVNLCAVLKAIVTDKREFRKLFVAHNWMRLSKDVSRPKLDI